MQPVITWLNNNSNAVEALGSVAAVLVSVGSLVVTIVLARLTRRYVALTNTIAAATKAQAEFNSKLQREAKEGAAESLYHHARRLKAVVSALPKDKPVVDQLRHFNLFGEGDVAELQRLTQLVGGEVYRQTTLALTGLHWLLGLIERIKATRDPSAYVLSPQEEGSYRRSVQLLTQELAIIVDTCRPAGAPSPTEDEAAADAAESSGWTGQFSTLFNAVTGQRPVTSQPRPDSRKGNQT
ncbi:MAG TPA: hypothetical protein VIM21_10690 [Gemmatimonadaceae bacterium]